MKSLAEWTCKSMQVNANQCKFAKPELVYGLREAFTSRKSRKFQAYHWLMPFYNNRLLAINLCRLALGGQTVKNLRILASKFELDQSQCKSMQVDASGWPNETQVECKSKICVDLRVHLARALYCKVHLTHLTTVPAHS